MGFMNVGVQLGLAGHSAAAGAALAVSGVCAGLVLWGFRRVKVRGGRGSCVYSQHCCMRGGRPASVPAIARLAALSSACLASSWPGSLSLWAALACMHPPSAPQRLDKFEKSIRTGSTFEPN